MDLYSIKANETFDHELVEAILGLSGFSCSCIRGCF